MVTTYDLESFATIECGDCSAPLAVRRVDPVVELRLARVDELSRVQAKKVDKFSGVIGGQALACLAE